MQTLELPIVKVRCSSNDRIDLCTASAIPPAVKIEGNRDAADLGTGVHTYMSHRLSTGQASVAVIAANLNLDPEELAPAAMAAWYSWEAVAKFFPSPAVEVPLPPLVDDVTGITMTGTADIVSEVDGVGRICDYKTGWSDRVHLNQLKGYARLLIEDAPYLTGVQATVLRTRFGETETFPVWSREELIEWHRGYMDRIARGLDVYSPSPEACGYCPRMHECPARTAMLRGAVETLTEADDEGGYVMAQLEGDEMGTLLTRAKWVASLADEVAKLIKAEVIARGGRVPLPDGRELRITETTTREIDFATGEGVITEAVGDRWREAVEIGNTKLAKLVRDGAGRGQKGKAVEKLFDDLDAAGAITRKVTKKLELKPVTKAIEEKQE